MEMDVGVSSVSEGPGVGLRMVKPSRAELEEATSLSDLRMEGSPQVWKGGVEGNVAGKCGMLFGRTPGLP